MHAQTDARLRLERLTSKVNTPSAALDQAQNPDWAQEKEALIAEGKRAVERWFEGRTRLAADWAFLADFRPSVCPTFQLQPADQALAGQCRVSTAHFGQNEIPLFYLSWELCPTTRGVPNPYEPVIAIWEQGGGFRREGNLLEISGSSGPVGGIGWPSGVVRTPASPRPSTPSQQPIVRGPRTESRAIRITLALLFSGIALLMAGIGTWTSDPASYPEGSLAHTIGPHLVALMLAVPGAVLLAFGIRYLIRQAKLAQATKDQRRNTR